MARRGGERGVCGSLLGQGVCVTLSLCEGRARGPAYARARVWQSLCKYVQRGWGWSSARGSGLLRGGICAGAAQNGLRVWVREPHGAPGRCVATPPVTCHRVATRPQGFSEGSVTPSPYLCCAPLCPQKALLGMLHSVLGSGPIAPAPLEIPPCVTSLQPCRSPIVSQTGHPSSPVPCAAPHCSSNPLPHPQGCWEVSLALLAP